MSHKVRKCPSSADPRDWVYMTHWQEWGEYVPPWNWEFFAPTIPQFGFVPVFGKFQAIEKSVTGAGGNFILWDQSFDVHLPVVGSTTVASFHVAMIAFDPAFPPLDPLGNPFTLSVTGSIFMSLPLGQVLSCTFAANLFQPPYNTEIVMPLTSTVEPIYLSWDGFMTMRPCIWNTPTLP